MLTHEMVWKDGVRAETAGKRQQARFSFLDSHIVLCSPAPEQPQTRVQRQKRSITKALYVMLSTSIDFPLFWPIFDRHHEIVASCHVRRGLGDQMPALLKSSAQKKKNKREILG